MYIGDNIPLSLTKKRASACKMYDLTDLFLQLMTFSASFKASCNHIKSNILYKFVFCCRYTLDLSLSSKLGPGL